MPSSSARSSPALSADLRVVSITVHGEVRGTVIAEVSVELQQTARVFGGLDTPALVVAKGALLEGTTRMVPRSVATAEATKAVET